MAMGTSGTAANTYRAPGNASMSLPAPLEGDELEHAQSTLRLTLAQIARRLDAFDVRLSWVAMQEIPVLESELKALRPLYEQATRGLMVRSLTPRGESPVGAE